MEQLALRLSPTLAKVLGLPAQGLSVFQTGLLDRPALRGVLARPVDSDVSFVLRVHARNGIPLASGMVTIACGEQSFETESLTFLGMEGYSHMSAADQRAIEDRVWQRREFVTGSAIETRRVPRV